MNSGLKIITDLLKQIIEIAAKGKNVAERLESNWDKDRDDFSEFKNRLGHMEEEFKSFREEFRKAMLALPKDTKEQVTQAVKPVQTEARKLKEVIQDKKIVALDKAETKKQVKKILWNPLTWFN